MERVASHRSEQRLTEITRKKLFHLQKLPSSRSWRQSIVDCRREGDSMKETLRWKKGTSLGQKNGERSEDWSRRNAQKLHCARDTRIWYQTHSVVGDARDIRHLQTSDGQQIKQFKRQHIFVIINASSGRNSATLDCSSFSSDRFQKSTADNDGANVPVATAANVLPAVTPKAHSRSSTPTKRAAGSMTLDVPSQAKRPRNEDPQMDVLKFYSEWNRDIWNRGRRPCGVLR